MFIEEREFDAQWGQVHMRRAYRSAIGIGLFLLVIALSGALNFSRLGESSLFSDEAIYAVPAHHAVAQGQWYPPVYQHAPYAWKPPLVVWPVAASFLIFGENEFADRVPSALAGVLAAGLLFVCATWMLGPWYGFFAAIVFATCPVWIDWHGPRQGVADPLSCLLLMIALASYQRYRDVDSRAWLFAACAATALSALCKGLFGPACIFLATASDAWYAGRAQQDTHVSARFASRTVWSTLRVPTLLLFSGISLYLPWLVDNALRTPEFLPQVYRDIVVRTARGLEPAHVPGAGYYVKALIEGFGYFGLLLMALGLFAAFRSGTDARHRGLRLTALWAVVIVALIQCSASKLKWYLDPALPALAVLVAAGARAVIVALASRKAWVALATAVLAVIAADHAVAGWRSTQSAPREIQMQALVRAMRSIPEVHFYSENFDTPPTRSVAGWNMYFREWNQYYLDQVEELTQPIPDELHATGCDIVLTDRAQELQGRPGFSEARVVPMNRFDEREGSLAILDLCQGRIEAKLRGG